MVYGLIAFFKEIIGFNILETLKNIVIAIVCFGMTWFMGWIISKMISEELGSLNRLSQCIKAVIKRTPTIQNQKKMDNQILQNIIKNGRKSLATVRNVRYRANSEKQYPEFVLRYAFNPPDDSEHDDLIHEVVVPYDLALKPGDALPILYTVSEDSTEVMSMPFPFPTKALPELFSCFCKTIRGVILSTPNTARN